MTTVDEAREALLAGIIDDESGMETFDDSLVDALIAAVRAEYAEHLVDDLTGAVRDAIVPYDPYPDYDDRWSGSIRPNRNNEMVGGTLMPRNLPSPDAATPAVHRHVIEYPSHCTGCEHLAASFVANAPAWMLVGRAATPAEDRDPWLDLDGDREAQRAATPAEAYDPYPDYASGFVEGSRFHRAYVGRKSLDVEVLADAMYTVRHNRDWPAMTNREETEAIAAEYARLEAADKP